MERNMANYMIAYHGGKQPTSKEEGMVQMQKWKEWVASLGDAVINPGTPLMQSQLVTSNNVSKDEDANSMKGFAIIEADSMEVALEIAKSDPFLETEGTIRLSQMMEM